MHYANLHPLAAVCYLGNIALIWLHKLFGDFLVDVSDIPKEAPDLNTLVEEGSLLFIGFVWERLRIIRKRLGIFLLYSSRLNLTIFTRRYIVFN